LLPRISRRLSALGLVSASLALLAFAPGALAANLGVDGSGNLVYTASGGTVSAVEFDQTDVATVEVHKVESGQTYQFNPFFDIGTFTDNDPITLTGTNCTNDADADTTPDTDGNGDPLYTCTGVTGQVQATAGDEGDAIDGSGLLTNLANSGLTTIPLIANLGTGNDSSIGGQANDAIHGGDDDDNVIGDAGSGTGGDDQLFGDAGEDAAAGGQGNDTVDGGAGNDPNLVGGPGTDTITGGDGDDGFIAGGPGDDTLDGGAGNDSLWGECNGGCGVAPNTGNDTITGGDGSDDLHGESGDDSLNAGVGDDTAEGGPGNDNIVAGEGDDFVKGGPSDDTIDGGAGDDYLAGDCDGGCGGGAPGNDTINGGDGNDNVHGEPGDDTLNGGAGDDGDVAGGPGNDTAIGGDGNDRYVAGGPGNDNVDGGAGDDYVVGDCGGYLDCGNGDDGSDNVAGGAGDDYSDADLGTDVVDLGSGIDTVAYPNQYEDCRTGCVDVSNPVNVTLDGVANDGGAGENDNVLNTEDVNVYNACCGGPDKNGPAAITGDANVNSLSGSEANDTIAGGAGNDFLYGNGGDDTLNANDGFADRVVCGTGNDTANVDEFDQVGDDCETVNRTTRGGLATEDAPPTVAWTSPASGATMSTSKANTLQVNATDDHGITQVIFMDGERVLCTDTTAPYTCDYKPIDADVGKDTLSAIAVDTRQQTASALRTVKVGRFAAKKLSAKTSPKKDSTAPFTFRTKGTLSLPSGVTKAVGCKGKVTVTFKAGKKTISTRRATLKKSCAYSSKVRFTLPGRLHPSKLRVAVRFGGNAVLAAKSAKRYSVKTR
jgi:Ca2+-binding RTX toxin-like protein